MQDSKSPEELGRSWPGSGQGRVAGPRAAAAGAAGADHRRRRRRGRAPGGRRVRHEGPASGGAREPMVRPT